MREVRGARRVGGKQFMRHGIGYPSAEKRNGSGDLFSRCVSRRRD